MLFTIFLILHIAAGTIGLVIGPFAMYFPKRKGLHTKLGRIYFYAMSLVCISAFGLSILHWKESWWLGFVAAFSFYFAGKGYLAAKYREESWVGRHISGMLGSYIAMTTALFVVNASSLPGYETLPIFVYWLLPTIIGTPLIVLTVRKSAR
jgi:uncharacterized membrane protein